MKTWKPGVSKPPLVCAGRKQLKTAAQANAAMKATNRTAHYCRFCGNHHLWS